MMIQSWQLHIGRERKIRKILSARVKKLSSTVEKAGPELLIIYKLPIPGKESALRRAHIS